MRPLVLCLGLLGAGIGVHAGADDSRVVNVGKANGYSIAFVEATPKPGTKLVEGQTVALNVVVNYDLRVADKGRIILVLQDQEQRLLFPGTKQISVEVARGSGTQTLSQEIQVPVGVRRINLSVPLVPAGLSRTSGELLIRYPVGRAK